MIASKENRQRLQLFATQHLAATGEKLTLVQMLDKILSQYHA
ncbi:hypothetical protein Q5H92_13820 [Hymenobacter sp. M29]|uniref:Uncharacterized protein n=1 Tax=Hymenobacter mellowenesis TaxID=3063995 RepID=A0ABT9AD26_9BACT|nr:hypothetical protein [Hymenobacter sp. M29]MDO7847443.1 hypothetical protein [Hymenobacter sp. M29]